MEIRWIAQHNPWNFHPLQLPRLSRHHVATRIPAATKEDDHLHFANGIVIVCILLYVGILAHGHGHE
jgi:hypothetical protein